MLHINQLENKGYSFNKEFCGYPQKKIVVRYCGDFICSRDDIENAMHEAIKHNIGRQKQYKGFDIIDAIINSYKR